MPSLFLLLSSGTITGSFVPPYTLALSGVYIPSVKIRENVHNRNEHEFPGGLLRRVEERQRLERSEYRWVIRDYDRCFE